MGKIVLVLILVYCTAPAFPQDPLCEKLFITQFDSAKEVYVKSIKEDIVLRNDEKSKLRLAFIAMENTAILSIVVTGASDCVDEASKLDILFRDGSRTEIVNNGGFNCDAEFSIFFGGDFGHKKELAMLVSKEIQLMRVTTRKSTIDKMRNNFVEVTVAPFQSKAIMEAINCLVSD